MIRSETHSKSGKKNHRGDCECPKPFPKEKEVFVPSVKNEDKKWKVIICSKCYSIISRELIKDLDKPVGVDKKPEDTVTKKTKKKGKPSTGQAQLF